MSEEQTKSELEAVYDEMDRLEGRFDEQATENRRAREAAELEQRQDTVGDQPEREFEPQVFLLVPYDETDHRRPLPRRPDAAAPTRSSGVVVRKNGSPTLDVEPGGNYTVECTVENAGGLGASTVNVELFVEHRDRTVSVDTNASGTVEFSTGARSQHGDFTGITTVSPNQTRPVTSSYKRLDHTPGEGIDPMGYAVYSGSDLTYETLLDVGRLPSRAIDPGRDVSARTWSVEYSSRPTEYLVTGKPYRSNTFTIRIYDIGLQPSEFDLINFRISPEWAAVYNTLARPQDLDSIQFGADILDSLDDHTLLTEVDGRWVQGASANQLEPLDLASDVDAASLAGRTRATVPPNGSTTVDIDYTAPASQEGRALTVLYLRAYSLAPEDTPGDWDVLDHTRSRFVGRSELYWPL